MKAGIRGSSAWLPAESRTGCIARSSPSRAPRTDRCAVRRARSPASHIRDALDGIAARHPGLIEKFGGHAMAAGMTLPESSLARISRAPSPRRSPRAPTPISLRRRDPLATASCRTQSCRSRPRALLRGAGPWGQGFPEPVFDGASRSSTPRVVGGRHLKLAARAAAQSGAARAPPRRRGAALEAIAFGYVGGASEDPALEPGATVDLAYRLEVNEYNGAERVQLNCQHLKLR